MIAGLYLGEIFRVVLTPPSFPPSKKIPLKNSLGQPTFSRPSFKSAKLCKAYTLDSSILSAIEEDPFEDLSKTAYLFKTKLQISPSPPELKLIRRLAELIGTRAARLFACDGSLLSKYTQFKDRGAVALREILDWGEKKRGERDPIEIAVQGSWCGCVTGVGAALIAALTLKRVKEGNMAGIHHPESYS
ncbi:hypothetical protein V491_01436 [Pseudogymnoascus sp. VKM F-3775]|nr:hypothetical protein V491_01436 [Pseudogymnoascus sp. VKM F-3775]